MFPNIFFCSSSVERQKKKKNASWTGREQLETVPDDSVQIQYLPQTVPFYGLPVETRPRLSLRSDFSNTSGGEIVKAKKNFGGKMSKVSNLSDLIQRVTASCLLHPLSGIERRENLSDDEGKGDAEEVYEYETDEHEEEEETDEDDAQIEGVLERRSGGSSTSSGGKHKKAWQPRTREVVTEMEMTMGQVFDAVSAMKKAYLKLQEAHCPWDPEKMRVADAAVLAEIRRLGVLRERFRRNIFPGGNGGGGRSGSGRMLMAATTIKEVVAPYEAAMDELKREVKAREVEVKNLKEKLMSFTVNGVRNGKKGRSISRKKVGCSLAQAPLSTSPELFEVTTSRVNDALRTFTSLLLSLMRSAHWDIAAAVRSIELASAAAEKVTGAVSTISSSVTTQHAKYALESYVARKMFQGFDHETFYMDGSLASLINPEQFRRDCFTQYRDMKAMEPTELLGVLPTCHFGKFCSKKYLAIVHPKMEESLFGDLEQHRQVVAGNHPRSQFYSEFLELAKTVWLLHMLAFSLDPVPSQFEASRGAEFHPQYMESVVKFPGGRVPPGQVVALPVSPGFKLWNGSVIKARVYLVPRS